MKKENSDSYFKDVIRKLSRHRLAMISFFVLVAEVLGILILPEVLNLDPNVSNPGFYAAPDGKHLLGTDQVGRDVFARILSGGKVSLTVGLLASVISAFIGIPLGLIAGYYRGIWEMVIMRLTEVFQSIPSIVLILVIVSITGPSTEVLILTIGVLGWSGFTRLIYGSVLSVREKEYVESARASGE